MALIESTKEASKGGFQGVKKVRGLLTSIEEVPSRFESKDGKDNKNQAQVTLKDAVILEMAPGEEPFELKDGTFTFWIDYAFPGKKPQENSAYVGCWLKSFEKHGITPSSQIGKYITLDKSSDYSYTQPKVDPQTNQPVYGKDGRQDFAVQKNQRIFCFVPDESEGSESVNAYIKGLIKGLNEKAALHTLLVDTKAKQFPTYRDALKSGAIGDMVGLKLVDGVFQEG